MTLRPLAYQLLASALLLVVGFIASPAFGQSGSATPLLGDGLQFGINGHYRLGHMTTVRLTDPDVKAAENIVLETLDGDGVRVRYHASDIKPGDQQNHELGSIELGLIVAGSEAAPVEVRSSVDGQLQTVAKSRLPEAGNPALGPSLIPPNMPWVVAIGDPLGIDSLGTSNVLTDKLARIAVSKVASAAVLPRQQLGYDGVDLVMINGAGIDVIGQMDQLQATALTRWIRSGGRILLTLGDSTEQVAELAPWLIDLLPLEDAELYRYDPAAFETYTRSQTPLDVFRGIKLPRRTGKTILLGRTTRRVSAVLIAEYIVGLGKASVIAADLEEPLFAEWPERTELVIQAVGELLEEENDRNAAADGSTTFNDLSGQMRGVLDQFAIKKQFGFSLVSLIVLILIAAIGPLDYLLINRVLGKPLLGWITFPLFAVVLSIVLVLQARPQLDPDIQAPESSMDLVRTNQIQITDLDLVDGVGRSFLWSSLYAHDPIKADLVIEASEDLAKMVTKDTDNNQSISFPFGYPGKVFGGIQLAGENDNLLPYEITADQTDGNQGDEFAGSKSQILNLTIAPRSSKSIATKKYFDADSEKATTVIRRPGSDLLRGDFTNPLPVDVLDGMLIYRNTAYLLPTRVPAGATIPSIENLRQRNFRWRLTRKVSSDDSSAESAPWSPGDFGDLGRVTDMLMFHEAAGGKLYTGLRHDILGELDLTDVLSEDRCMLIGRSEQPLVQLGVIDRTSDQDSELRKVTSENVLSMVRVVLPVRSTLLSP
ncbi:hypothetical protein LOC67_03415 [Stieleria sp. JC731]|uniref:hypothetical protein n=1 Tax=Pirellulaceae TaxID=2691357 RepID=UPI001E395436|nr:hypothetical protein [Stieleria sp. JC731]MCC9599597.1 hypothetical protein [Stieleria sp. JC731]